jgi:hypothetical protein
MEDVHTTQPKKSIRYIIDERFSKHFHHNVLFTIGT